MKITFTEIGWEDYIHWQQTDKKMIKKINDLLEDISRNGNTGIGRPEPLKHNLSGNWSRRINLEHRLIYSIEDGTINIVSCKGHYD